MLFLLSAYESRLKFKVSVTGMNTTRLFTLFLRHSYELGGANITPRSDGSLTTLARADYFTIHPARIIVFVSINVAWCLPVRVDRYYL
jgi:hypothetical protein